jgi:FtsP/CotA-like multicopper oxidase with cupredoxin domain
MRKFLPLSMLALSFTVAATSPVYPAQQPDGWDSQIKLKEAVDINPDPNIVEIRLEARVARTRISETREIEAWTYDGGLPGPLIRIKVGARLIVHFTNKLPKSTTVHWHGVRVPIEMDGVPGISQPEVQPGEGFTYDFVVPDAGLFWYHPHVLSALQVGNGLYGALLVEDPAESLPPIDELVLVLSDIGIEKDGSLSPADSGGTTGMAFGREGDIVLVNGRNNSTIFARPGALQRWRVVNTAKSRYFQIFLGQTTTFTRIGGDGGFQEFPTKLDLLVLAPGERADVIVTPLARNETEVVAMHVPFNRGYGSVEYRPVDPLFKIVARGTPESRSIPVPEVRRKITPLSKDGATPVELNLNITQDRSAGFEYNINGKPYWMATPLRARLGETQLWTVNNTTPWSHPLHIHGYFFQVLDAKGEVAHPIEWKDTVDVPLKQTLKLLVKFEDRPGQWMVHCHILDHAEGGLMTTIVVGDAIAKEHVHEK